MNINIEEKFEVLFKTFKESSCDRRIGILKETRTIFKVRNNKKLKESSSKFKVK